MERTKWIERKFNFDFPGGIFPSILERLRGTPARIKEIALTITDEEAKQKPGNKWSIKEHIGHLYDLEHLHEGRIDDFLARKETLRPADMTNAVTNQANHNDEPMPHLLQLFTEARVNFVLRLEELDEDVLNFRSLHPRLQVMMRPVDLAYFTAEHDDHHLASIREIIQAAKK
jgi:hypothetical protein